MNIMLLHLPIFPARLARMALVLKPQCVLITNEFLLEPLDFVLQWPSRFSNLLLPANSSLTTCSARLVRKSARMKSLVKFRTHIINFFLLVYDLQKTLKPTILLDVV